MCPEANAKPFPFSSGFCERETTLSKVRSSPFGSVITPVPGIKVPAAVVKVPGVASIGTPETLIVPSIATPSVTSNVPTAVIPALVKSKVKLWERAEGDAMRATSNAAPEKADSLLAFMALDLGGEVNATEDRDIGRTPMSK